MPMCPSYCYSENKASCSCKLKTFFCWSWLEWIRKFIDNVLWICYIFISWLTRPNSFPQNFYLGIRCQGFLSEFLWSQCSSFCSTLPSFEQHAIVLCWQYMIKCSTSVHLHVIEIQHYTWAVTLWQACCTTCIVDWN